MMLLKTHKSASEMHKPNPNEIMQLGSKATACVAHHPLIKKAQVVPMIAGIA